MRMRRTCTPLASTMSGPSGDPAISGGSAPPPPAATPLEQPQPDEHAQPDGGE
jgi:hypothetical protein